MSDTSSYYSPTKLSSDNYSPIKKICVVCGEPAKTYHYDTISCNGCKTFFRRALIGKKNYECKRAGKCDVLGGSKCQSCRFDQCIKAGMNPKLIQYPEDIKVDEALRTIESRKRKIMDVPEMPSESQTPECSRTSICSTPFSPEPRCKDLEYGKEIELLIHTETKLKRLRESKYNPSRYNYTILDIVKKPCELGYADKYDKPIEWPMNIEVILSKVDKFYEPSVDDDGEFNIRSYNIVNEFILIMEAAKTLPFFDQLKEDDRVILLQHVALANGVLTQCFYSLEQKQQTIIFPDGFIPLKFLLKRLNMQQPSRLNLESYDRCLEPLMRTRLNLTEYVLLKAMIYCYSFIPTLSENAKMLLEKFRTKYALMLLRYLQIQHGEMPGATKYMEIISMINTYFYFAQRRKQQAILYTMEDKNFLIPKMYYELYHL